MQELLNEKGITSKKIYDECSKVNLEYINSDEFKLKFKNITKYENVNKTIYRVCKAILIHRSGTFLEDIYLIDSKTGEIVAKQTHPNVPNEVYYDSEIREIFINSYT